VTIKKNNKMKILMTLFFLIYFSAGLIKSQVLFTAKADKIVGLTSSFKLEFTVNQDYSNIVLPELNDFKVMAGPFKSSSSSIQIISGNTTKSASYTLTYHLQAKKTGKFEIGKASVLVDSIKYFSEPINIEVVDKNRKAPNDSTFLQIILDKKVAYLGEQINLSINIYSNADISDIENMNFPLLPYFYKESYNDSNQVYVEKEWIDGVLYQKARLKRYILVPITTGDLQIDPFNVDCTIKQKSDTVKNSFSFFFAKYDYYLKKLKSTDQTIKVLPLPENKPDFFSGAVGKDFKIRASVDKSLLSCNDSLKLKIAIIADACLKLFDKPEPVFNSSWDVSDVEVTYLNKEESPDSINTLYYSYLIFPREKGHYTIPELKLSYFDVGLKQYKTISTEPITIKIKAGNCSEKVSEKEEEKVKLSDKVSDIILALDISGTTLARDFQPDRLSACKEEIVDFIKKNTKDRIGLVAFAGKSLPISPLSENRTMLMDLTSKIDTGIVEDGTAIGSGLLSSINKLKGSKAKNRYIILITDGNNNSGEIEPLTAAQIAKILNIRVYVIGIGKNDTVSFSVKTTFGIQEQKIFLKLDEESLINMTKITNGKFFKALKKEDLPVIFNQIALMEKNIGKEVIKSNEKPNFKNNTLENLPYETAIRILKANETDEQILLQKLEKEKLKKESDLENN